jgi:hypothetical protein
MKNKSILSIVLLTLVSAIAYLPLVGSFGYYYDDWYLMYSVGANGPSVFWDIFSVDRPYRALVMIPAYSLFGANPLYYNLSAYLFRLAGALALFWILKMLWPRHQSVTSLMALLFLIYPGFLSQPNAIDYQCHIVGLAAALFSIALTLRAILSESRITKIILHLASFLPGWLYLGQMEWYIGFEFFRWACVFLLSSRSGGTLLQKGWRAIQWAYPSLAVPGVFLVWRLFFFQSKRGATDVDVQFSQLTLYPLQTLYHWALQVAQDFFDVTLAAWVIPLSQLDDSIQLWIGLLAILATSLTVFVLYKMKEGEVQSEPQQIDLQREALLLGFFTAVGGLAPIAMVNRDVWFPSFSRYALVSSVGVAILIPAVLMHLNGTTLRNGIAAAFCLIAILTHHANAVKHVQETAITRNFWWQVAWRVPQFEKNTTLVANIPGVATEEDYFVWGPASLIYYPERQNPKGIQPGLFAAILNRDTVTKVLARERQEFDNRKNIITYKNYRNFVLLNQPSINSCVHILNGSAPEYARDELDSIRAIGSYSEIEHILTDETPHAPPEIVFGPEPSHGWCYYYQKADLDRQKVDWEAVIKTGDQAFEQGLAPTDPIEWMPFLQAYAQTGNVDRLKELAPRVSADPYIALQACYILGNTPGLSAEVTETITTFYCFEQ